MDDFETCNPKCTSRQKHKLCAVYWILGNLPPGSHSSLSSIYLALLAKTDNLKKYGYTKVLQPLLQDIKTIEDNGVYIPLLGKSLKRYIADSGCRQYGSSQHCWICWKHFRRLLLPVLHRKELCCPILLCCIWCFQPKNSTVSSMPCKIITGY